MKQSFILKTIACSLFFMANLAFANEWYQVEVIVFEHPLDETQPSELWATHPGEPNWQKSRLLMDKNSASQLVVSNEADYADYEVRKAEYDIKKAEYDAAVQAEKEKPPIPDNAYYEENGYYYDDDDDIIGPITDYQARHAVLPEPPSPPEAPNITVDSNGMLGSEIAFTELSPSQFTLTGVLNKLNAQGGYRVMAHTAWRQPALSNNQTEAVRIFGGNILGQDTNGPTYEFEGLVTFKKSRYLHVEADLVLREKTSGGGYGNYASPQELGLLDYDRGARYKAPSYTRFRLTQSQRVRSNKLYYYDHPLMGMIVKVSPYEPK